MEEKLPPAGGPPDEEMPEIVEDSPSAVSSAEPALPFETLGHFQIVSRLGSGGMGDVYLGFEKALERFVAIKVLPAESARQGDFVKRFKAEATAAARLVHPHVVQIYFIGEDGGNHYFAMQHVDGESLAKLLKRHGRLEAGEALCVIEQVLDGLAAAHDLKLVHRDIKPGNILLDRGTRRALLADFGLVKALDGSQTMGTTGGTVLGTAEYLSPEQAEGDEIDARSDLYSTGVMLFHLLTGELPFRGKSMTTLMYKHVHERPPRLSQMGPGIPKSLSAIVDRLLAKHPDERFQTAHELREALLDVPGDRVWPAGTSPGSPAPAGQSRGTTRGRKASVTIAGRHGRSPRRIAGIALITIACLGGILWWSLHDPTPTIEQRNGTPVASGDAQIPGTVGAERKLESWTLPDGTKRFEGHVKTIRVLGFSPHGTQLLSGDAEGLILIRNLETDVVTTKIEGIASKVALRRATFTIDGTAILSCWADPVIRMFDAESGNLTRTFDGHTEVVHAVRQVPNSRLLISAGRDVSLRLWNMDTGETVKKFGAERNVVNLPAVPSQEDLRKLDGHISWIRDVVALPDGRHAISAGNDSILFLWDILEGELVDHLVGHNGNVFDLVLSPKGDLLFSSADDHRIRLWSISERKPIQGWPYEDSRSPPMTFAANAQAGAIGHENGEITIRDIALADRIIATLQKGPGAVTALTFAAEDQWLVAGYIDGSLIAWPVGKILQK